MLYQDDSQPLQPLQHPPDDPSDQAAFGLVSPPQQLQQLQQGSVQQASAASWMQPAEDQNNGNSMSPFPHPSSPFTFSSTNPISPSFSISDASTYGSPASSSPFYPTSPLGSNSAFAASNMQAAPNGLFNPSTQFVSHLSSPSDTSTMHTAPIGSFSSMPQFAYNFNSGDSNMNLSGGFVMTDFAPSRESIFDPSSMQAASHGLFPPETQMAQSTPFAPFSSPFAFPQPDPMQVVIKELEELERQYQEILNKTPKKAPPLLQAPPLQAPPTQMITLDEPIIYILDEQETSPTPADYESHSQDYSFIVPSPKPFGGSGATLPIQHLLRQPSSLQPWDSGVQLLQQPTGRSYGQHPQPRNHTKVDLWSLSSASQLTLSVGATSPPPDDPFSTNKLSESPTTMAELFSGVKDEPSNDEGSMWIQKPVAAAGDWCDEEEDSSADSTFVDPSPYSRVPPSPWVPQNKLLLTEMDPPPPPAAPVFAVLSKPAPKTVVEAQHALNSFQGEQREIIMGLIDKIEELTSEKEGEKAEKEKKKPVIEGNSRFDKSSLARRTNPAIFQFPATNRRDVQLDLCRAMADYTEIERISKTSISNFIKHVLRKVYEDPMASRRVTSACVKSTKGYRVLQQSSVRTLAKFWLDHFTHTHEHSLTRITDLMTFTMKNVLDKNRSDMARGLQQSSSKST